jgi:5-methyltetrahydrofolate--homocysteine methyltransferase
VIDALTRPLILDGAMGTMLPQKHDTSRLCLTQPALVSAVHEAYLEAGADIITTNSFQAHAIAQAESGDAGDVRAINLRAAQLARDAADAWGRRIPAKPRFVAGGIGPIKPAAPDATKAAYREQIRALLDGGVDLLLLETVVDAASARDALAAVHDEFAARGASRPLMVSASLTREGRLLSGETVEDFYALTQSARPFSVGLNCSFGARHLRAFLERLARVAQEYVTCHPSAGLPSEAGAYPDTPSEMAATLADLVASRVVDIAGGCCGTTPAHISAIADALQGGVRTPDGPARPSRGRSS